MKCGVLSFKQGRYTGRRHELSRRGIPSAAVFYGLISLIIRSIKAVRRKGVIR